MKGTTMKMREISSPGSSDARPITDQLSNLDRLAEKYTTATAQVLTRDFPTPSAKGLSRGSMPAPVRAAADPNLEAATGSAVDATGPAAQEADLTEFVEPLPDLVQEERRKVLEAGGQALRKVIDEGANVDLAPLEVVGLEAIVFLEARPALFIQNGRFFPAPDDWQILEQERVPIENTLRSVGRIEISGHPSKDWVGTGFLVAKDVVMTNRHVAEVFCQMGKRRRWQFKSGMAGQIDYVEELGATNSSEFELRSVIGVHEEYDMALFRVRRTAESGAKPPTPLTIASKPQGPLEHRQVYTIGYPAWDGQRNDPPVMQRIFSDIYNIKRLQPGAIMEMRDSRNILLHDCSTLGGNSGSCVVDLETHQVMGLHFGGRYQRGNVAVALWKLIEDPLLQKAKVHFA